MVSNFIEAKENIKPDAIILELPFTSLLNAVQAIAVLNHLWESASVSLA